jgi:hypothetical protein
VNSGIMAMIDQWIETGVFGADRSVVLALGTLPESMMEGDSGGSEEGEGDQVGVSGEGGSGESDAAKNEVEEPEEGF